jgi:hypothetical protein
VEVMSAFEKASNSGRFVNIKTEVKRPKLLVPNLPDNVLDA